MGSYRYSVGYPRSTNSLLKTKVRHVQFEDGDLVSGMIQVMKIGTMTVEKKEPRIRTQMKSSNILVSWNPDNGLDSDTWMKTDGFWLPRCLSAALWLLGVVIIILCVIHKSLNVSLQKSLTECTN